MQNGLPRIEALTDSSLSGADGCPDNWPRLPNNTASHFQIPASPTELQGSESAVLGAPYRGRVSDGSAADLQQKTTTAPGAFDAFSQQQRDALMMQKSSARSPTPTDPSSNVDFRGRMPGGAVSPPCPAGAHSPNGSGTSGPYVSLASPSLGSVAALPSSMTLSPSSSSPTYSSMASPSLYNNMKPSSNNPTPVAVHNMPLSMGMSTSMYPNNSGHMMDMHHSSFPPGAQPGVYLGAPGYGMPAYAQKPISGMSAMVVIPPIKEGSYECSGRGLTVEGHSKATIQSLHEHLFPNHAHNQPMKATKSWWNAQLLFYGLPVKRSATIAKIQDTLREAIRDGRLRDSDEIMQLEKRLNVEYQQRLYAAQQSEYRKREIAWRQAMSIDEKMIVNPARLFAEHFDLMSGMEGGQAPPLILRNLDTQTYLEVFQLASHCQLIAKTIDEISQMLGRGSQGGGPGQGGGGGGSASRLAGHHMSYRWVVVVNRVEWLYSMFQPGSVDLELTIQQYYVRQSQLDEEMRAKMVAAMQEREKLAEAERSREAESLRARETMNQSFAGELEKRREAITTTGDSRASSRRGSSSSSSAGNQERELEVGRENVESELRASEEEVTQSGPSLAEGADTHLPKGVGVGDKSVIGGALGRQGEGESEMVAVAQSEAAGGAARKKRKAAVVVEKVEKKLRVRPTRGGAKKRRNVLETETEGEAASEEEEAEETDESDEIMTTRSKARHHHLKAKRKPRR